MFLNTLMEVMKFKKSFQCNFLEISLKITVTSELYSDLFEIFIFTLIFSSNANKHVKVNTF